MILFPNRKFPKQSRLYSISNKIYFKYVAVLFYILRRPYFWAILHIVEVDKYRRVGWRFLGKIWKHIYIFQNFVVDIIHHFSSLTIGSLDLYKIYINTYFYVGNRPHSSYAKYFLWLMLLVQTMDNVRVHLYCSLGVLNLFKLI